MTMTPTEWAAAARNEEYRTDPRDQKAIDVLESLLLAQQSPSDAATAVAAIFEASAKDRGNDGATLDFWAILCDATRKLGGVDDHAERMADLVIAMQALPDVLDSSGAPVTFKWGGVFWSRLPGWHMMFRDHGIYTDAPEDFVPWPWREQSARLLNTTIFAATLMTRAPFDSAMESHALEAFSCALSLPSDGNDEQEQREEHEWAELYLPTAAVWILRAGPKLREASRIRRPGGHTTKFSPEQWNGWKLRFEELSVDTTFDQESRDLAAQAARQMEPLPIE